MKIQECNQEVDDQWKSSVPQILKKSTDFLRRIIREEPRCRTRVLTATDSRLKTTPDGKQRGTGRGSATGARRVAAITTGGNRTESWFFRTARTARTAVRRRCSKGVCEILVNALKLLANQQLRGASLVQMLVEGFEEQNRVKIKD